VFKYRVPGNMEPGICVVSLCYNEISILPIYYKYVKQFADTWIILDDGSTDGSVEYIKRLQDKKELDIMLVSRPSFDFTYHRVFWANWNYVISLSDREWTLLGYLDEIAYPNPREHFEEMMSDKAVWMIPREEVVSIKPFKSLGIDGPFVRFFPTGSVLFEAKPQSVHVENPVIRAGYEVKAAKFKMYHIGRCREISHIREKERSYEACGETVLTSRYSEERRRAESSKACELDDKGFVNWLYGGE